ncbi:MAG: AI-2E family transporter [Halomonas sp.]|jgi:AI-2 transport protein TqsA|nr:MULTISPECIES: AI-2E family transporter [Halomonas]MCE8032601.1 AI-2E family transporter [Halomonas sp. MCCC 1A11057]MDX5376162.1 AI-2E family transporter [Halomonas sp.]
MHDHRVTPGLNPQWVIALVLIVASLYWLRVLAVPLAFSLLLMALVWPIYQHRAFKRRVLHGLSLVASVLFVLIAVAAILSLIGYGIRLVADGLSLYGAQMQETYRSIGLWFAARDISLEPTMAEQLSPSGLLHLVHETAARINAIIGFLALTLIFLIMGLLEAGTFQRRLPHALGADAAERLLTAFEELGWKFRRYMLIRSAVSVLTGILTWLFALSVGLDLAVVWGLLAFSLNYIPFVGSILAVFPPTIFAVVQFASWQTPVVVLAGMALIQFSIGNFLDPRLEGRALAISPFAVIFSIFFWSIVWGIPGAFIGVPLTIALITICGHFHETCWIKRLLSPPPMPEGIKHEK